MLCPIGQSNEKPPLQALAKWWEQVTLTFDIAWKVMKDILVKNMGILDFATGSPRETLQQAFTNRLIDDDAWMQMLKTRNQLAHDYDGTFAEQKFEDIIHIYYPLFEKLKEVAKVYQHEKL